MLNNHHNIKFTAVIYHKGEENTESVICKLYEHLPITYLSTLVMNHTPSGQLIHGEKLLLV